MNKFYDLEAAREALKSYTGASVEKVTADVDEDLQHLAALDLDDMVVVATGKSRPVWRLAHPAADGSTEAEFMCRAQGVLTKVHLIPGDMSRLTPQQAHNTSQQIAIAGLGCDLFDQGVNNIKKAESVFTRHFQTDVALARAEGADDAVLNASNRFFTSLTEELLAEHVDFLPEVDPLGRLAKFVGQELVHTMDNRVAYYKRSAAAEPGEFVYIKAFPANFRLGDIVEIEFAFIAFKSKMQGIKMHCNLRLVTLIDATLAKAAEEAQMKANIAVTTTNGTKLRRKLPYGEGETEEQNNSKRQKESAVSPGE
ncbi:hypothetical protein DFH06DRAFT_1144434 [Mycena polygramma]|nr:hypothetical protein DFH06DRAFT_1144434 [Mycena polygramma]